MRRFAMLFFICTGLVEAELISSFTSGTAMTLGTYGRGQSVLTPAGGPWTNITFCFAGSAEYAEFGDPGCWADFGMDPRYPFQPGGLFVLTQEYLGTPVGLSPATPGFLAVSSTMVDAHWVFGSELTLAPLTVYYFYTDSVVHTYELLYPDGPMTGYATYGGDNGNALCADHPYCLFQPKPTNNYKLTGVAVPEPASGWLLGAGCLALMALRVRRRS